MSSEVAQLRRQIERECEALQMLKHAFAAVASHEIINHHYEQLGAIYERLAPHVGEQAAIDLIAERLEAHA